MIFHDNIQIFTGQRTDFDIHPHSSSHDLQTYDGKRILLLTTGSPVWGLFCVVLSYVPFCQRQPSDWLRSLWMFYTRDDLLSRWLGRSTQLNFKLSDATRE